MLADSIHEYFRRNYGEVKRVDFYTIPEYRFAVVKFILAENALKPSQRKQHTIAGRIVNVSIADEIHRQCYLLSLNDYCLVEILKCLEWKDLCAISDVCSRLAELAQMAFTSKYKNRVFKMITYDEEIEEKFLQTFGSLIQSMCLEKCRERHFIRDDTNILFLLQKYCGSLTTLKLRFYNFSDQSVTDTDKLIPLFYRLRKLILNHSSVSSKMRTFFNEQRTLEVVRVYK